jgi:arabinogalactan endo-1,4-beta-galactosidase
MRPVSGLALLKQWGVRLIRVRVWVHPNGVHSSLAEAVQLAKRAHAVGLDVAVDLHYSDTWADPGHQTIPASWQNLSHTALVNRVRIYTRGAVQAFVRAGVVPTFVQPGNEITNGMLWPDGRLQGPDEAAWLRFVDLVNAGISGIRDATPRGRRIGVLIHSDRGGDAYAAQGFFDRAFAWGMHPIDAIGLSYYPQWHGPLANLRATMDALANSHHLPLYVVETAYPWTTRKFGGSPVIDSSSLLPGYPATTAGQAGFVRAVRKIVAATPHRLGRGVWWWEPLARDVPKNRVSQGWTGGMQNATLVDSSGKPLPAMRALAVG